MFFKLLCLGHFVSMLGTALTGYGIALWYLGQHQAVVGYSFLAFSAVAPGILFAPFASVWADRFDRRYVLMVAHGIAGLCSLAIIFLYLYGYLTLWAILPFVMLSSASNSLLTPTFIAITSQMVAKEHLGRMSGIMGIAQALVLIVIPPLAALLVGWRGLGLILTIDVITFSFALTTLVLFRTPLTTSESSVAKPVFWLEFKAGLVYIYQRPSLRALIGFFWWMGFAVAIVNILLPPLVLTFGSPQDVAMVLAAGGVGILAGGLTLAIWGGPKAKIKAIVGFSLMMGVAYELVILPPSLWILAFAAVIVMFAHGMVTGCHQVIWQHKVPLQLQGRVFATATALSLSAIPLGYLVAGLLVENVFEPWMNSPVGVAEAVAKLTGSGDGRGMAVMIALTGLVVILISITSWFRPVLMDIDRLLPDQLPDSEQTSGKIVPKP